MCETCKEYPRLKIAHNLIKFILEAIREERAIFNYESLFTRLLMEGIILEDSVQELVSVIDLQNEENQACDYSLEELKDDTGGTKMDEGHLALDSVSLYMHIKGE